MASSRSRTAYWQGFRDGVPFIIVIVPFALIFGVIAVETGLTAGQTMGFSVIVIAGAAQFAALQLMSENAPFLVTVATALAVNLRMAMYSASLAPHVGAAPLWQRLVMAYLNVDQTYAMSVARYEAQPDMTMGEKFGYFVGIASPVVPVWYTSTLVGAVAGRRIPEELSLEFAVPVTFLAIVSLMLRTRAHWAAAATSVVVALALRGLPLNAGLLIAAAAAMGVGAGIETWTERRHAS